MLNNQKNTSTNWSALAIQKILWDLQIIPKKMEHVTDSIYLFLTENDTKKIVTFLMDQDDVEFYSSQNEVIIPLCLPDSLIKQLVSFDETLEERISRHAIEHRNRLVYFLENLFGYSIITCLRKQILKKTARLINGDNNVIRIDCFNKAEADYLKNELSSYGFSVSTAKCDTCVIMVDLKESSVSKTSRIVIEFCKQMAEVGLNDVSRKTIQMYRDQRIPEEN